MTNGVCGSELGANIRTFGDIGDEIGVSTTTVVLEQRPIVAPDSSVVVETLGIAFDEGLIDGEQTIL